MAILNSEKKLSLADREIELFMKLGEGHQMGHVLIQPREKMNDNYLAHEENEYLYLIRGELSVKTRTEDWKIKAGQFNLIPKGTDHRVENLSDEEAEFVFFNINDK